MYSYLKKAEVFKLTYCLLAVSSIPANNRREKMSRKEIHSCPSCTVIFGQKMRCCPPKPKQSATPMQTFVMVSYKFSKRPGEK